MAVLGNGLITLDFGSVTWVTDMNTNFGLMSQASNLFSGKALITHAHDAAYELSATTIDQVWLEPYLQVVDTDITFTNNTEGIVVVDITAADNKRIFIDNGIISTEVVI